MRIHKYEAFLPAETPFTKRFPEKEKDAFSSWFSCVSMRDILRICSFIMATGSTARTDREKNRPPHIIRRNPCSLIDARRKMLLYYNKVMADGKWDGILNRRLPAAARRADARLYAAAFYRRAGDADLGGTRKRSLCSGKPGVKWLELGNAGQEALILP